MKELAILLIYRALLPLLFIFAFPGWVVKMLKRGGFGTALNERIGIYTTEAEFEPSGAVHLHAVSVGETALALKLLRKWQAAHPGTRFVLATGTSTGHAFASMAEVPGLRVTYSPLDFPWMIRSYLNRFEPSQVVLIEGEIWPNFLRIAQKRGIPVGLANARVSPHSARRFLKIAPLLRPFFSRLSAICIQEEDHRKLWETLGIDPKNIHLTGSLKFDPQSSDAPQLSKDFTKMLSSFGNDRPVVLAASTFPGEETLIASAILAANPQALPVIVPRHAERRAEVFETLTKAGFNPILRTAFQPPNAGKKNVFVIDTTGELATWTSHADVVVIGKSFLSTGGQNPAEAILARKPLVFGQHMENFQPLAAHLVEAKAVLVASSETEISKAIRTALVPAKSASLSENAMLVLARHDGATQKHLQILQHTCQTA
ncbi:MAG: hypothetical protein IZT59_06425 [Verrucomicrobia bacterium]|jgi:3-deoxy-D-manno-octulosonic-acid transferase|nr:hypothetical protein [Verrucomicrobiota bacterium]|tara:strand:- start:4247 stop:5536 length:1290 start_codon:yes stop_codon:yes gene_type:complete